jgi:hypothetical protein
MYTNIYIYILTLLVRLVDTARLQDIVYLSASTSLLIECLHLLNCIHKVQVEQNMEDIDKVLEQCGGCMLAVSVLAHVLKAGDSTLQDILNETQAQLSKFDTVEYINDDGDGQTRKTIYNVCQFALKDLIRKQGDDTAKCDNCYHYLYALASFPAAQAVNKSTLRSTYNCIASIYSGRSPDTPDVAILRTLSQFGLIQQSSSDSCELHAIVADYVLKLNGYKTSVLSPTLVDDSSILSPFRVKKYTQLLSILVLALHDKKSGNDDTTTGSMVSASSKRAELRKIAVDKLALRNEHIEVLDYLSDRNYQFSGWNLFRLLPLGDVLTLPLLESYVKGDLQLFMGTVFKLMDQTNMKVRETMYKWCNTNTIYLVFLYRHACSYIYDFTMLYHTLTRGRHQMRKCTYVFLLLHYSLTIMVL